VVLKSLFPLITAVAIAAAPMPSAAAPAGVLVDYFIVQYPSISPNGDGVRDSSLVRVGLGETCSTLRLTVIDVGGTPVDTLIEETGTVAGTVVAVWSGRNSAGGPLPEGNYRLRLFASNGTASETYDRAAAIDLTAPLVSIERIEPGIYAPGVAGAADSVFIYCSINRYGSGDTLSLAVTNPSFEAERRMIPISGDGGYRAAWWAPTTAEDGIYRVTLVAADEGGNATADSAAFDVDTEGPEQEFIDNPSNYTNNPSPVITGRAHDRNGIYGLALIWQGGEPFPPDSTYANGDTLFWRFDASDSIPEGGGGFELKARCSDIFTGSARHTTEIKTNFTVDVTPPQPPILEQPPSPAREPSVLVHGSMEEANLKYIYLYRTADTDTMIRYEPAGDAFTATIPLRPGTNTIRATAQDRAGNVSDYSNAVTVVYEPANTIVWPEVFRAPDAFQVYSLQPAHQVTIDIYTVNGERVVSLSENGPAQSFIIAWNLTNDDGEEVRNGAYLAVVTVRYDSGTQVYKEFVAVVR
jgi:flagellar hook assembly protein FlgD